MQLRHIIVATDESEAGRWAVRAGLDLAARASARLTVMRVVSVDAVPLLGSITGGLGEPDGAGTALERLQQWLEPELESGPPMPVELGIAFGVPGVEICRFAEQRGADLLVLGRKRRSAVARLLVGDTADAVIRRSRLPCLFVEQGSMRLSRLLVALDGSERGMRVFGAARDLASAVDAEVAVVTVEDVKDSKLPEQVPPLPLTRSSRLWGELQPAAGRGRASTRPAEIAVAIRQGRAVPEILAELVGSDADALAFGSHRGGPAGILEAGGTARHLAHTAPVSVLTVPI